MAMARPPTGAPQLPSDSASWTGPRSCLLAPSQHARELSLCRSLNTFPSLVMPSSGSSCSRRAHIWSDSTLIQAAWTRRSRNQPPTRPNKRSWGQRVDKYMRPFKLDIMISRRYVGAKVVHRVTSKVVSVVTTNAKDLRFSLPSLTDANACRTIGKLLAERTKDADVYAVTYEPRKNEKVEGQLAVILETITQNDIALI